MRAEGIHLSRDLDKVRTCDAPLPREIPTIIVVWVRRIPVVRIGMEKTAPGRMSFDVPLRTLLEDIEASTRNWKAEARRLLVSCS